METTGVRLTVFFEDPFWVGVFERRDGSGLAVSRVVFGAEPKDAEVWNFVLHGYYRLRFSPAVDAPVRERAVNPKRMQRQAHRQTQSAGVGTKSQQALQLQREQMKTERHQQTREQLLAEQERQYALRQQRRKEKHRGH